MTELQYWVGFNIVPGIGPARFAKLMQYFGTAEAAWRASSLDLVRAGLDQKSLSNLLSLRQSLDLDAEMEKVERSGAHVVTLQDESYPRLLREIHLPPPVLYLRGTHVAQDEWAVAVVGTRSARSTGKEMTEYLAGALARNGITVVSGLARGIDSIAHRASLDARGRTIAVLGSGVDVIYPYENSSLANDIIAAGALVSEYSMGTKPDKMNFPPRNRIISGLSLGTLVTQAGEGSGALITAADALEQGREVFAVPGSALDRTFAGTNRLIQQGGAKLVLRVEDVLEELNLTMVAEQVEMRAQVPENETEALLLQQLSAEPAHVDDLVRASGLPTAVVSATLTLMELKGLVRQSGNMHYVLAR